MMPRRLMEPDISIGEAEKELRRWDGVVTRLTKGRDASKTAARLHPVCQAAVAASEKDERRLLQAVSERHQSAALLTQMQKLFASYH